MPADGAGHLDGQRQPRTSTGPGPDPEVDMRELLVALGEVLRRADMFESHHIQREALSTRERMSQVLEQLAGQQFVPFVALFSAREGRLRRGRHLPGDHGTYQGITGGNRADRGVSVPSTSRQERSSMSEIGLVQIVEGALLAAGKPSPWRSWRTCSRNKTAGQRGIRAVPWRMAALRGAGFELQEVASGFLPGAPEPQPLGGPPGTSAPEIFRALLETLALIAYRQPITRGEIEEIRGWRSAPTSSRPCTSGSGYAWWGTGTCPAGRPCTPPPGSSSITST